MSTKLINCKVCGEEIAKSAKMCPHCGAKNKKPFYKKVWFWLLILIIIGSMGGRSDTETEPTSTMPTAMQVTTKPTAKPTTKPATEPSTEPQPKISFEGITAVDNAECTIKITEIDASNMWGYTLKVLLENKSPDKTYMFSVYGASVNGIDATTAFAVEVAPGKKANDTITFHDDILRDIEFTDIELTFRVYDSNDWMADEVAFETVNIYPYGQENATMYVREAKSTDTILVDNELATVIITDYEKDNIFGYCANVYLVNKTDTEAMFTVDESSVNGFMIDPFWAKSVLPGKCAFSTISWSNTNLEENGITTVEELEFILRVYDSQNLFNADFVNQVFTLTP